MRTLNASSPANFGAQSAAGLYQTFQLLARFLKSQLHFINPRIARGLPTRTAATLDEVTKARF